jgi:branched-chain amino acid aminotransferase
VAITEGNVVWMDGELVPWGEAKVHVLTHALHYGYGVFEGIRAYETARGPAVFRLREHLERFHRSAHMLLMEIPYSVPELITPPPRWCGPTANPPATSVRSPSRATGRWVCRR